MTAASRAFTAFATFATFLMLSSTTMAGQNIDKSVAKTLQPLAQKLQDAADAANDIATNKGYPNTASWSEKLSDEAEDVINQLSNAVGGDEVAVNDVRDNLRDIRKTVNNLRYV